MLKNKAHKCYQIQIKKNICYCVYLGRYNKIMVPINKIIRNKNYLYFLVTYILNYKEVKNNIYKIVGVIVNNLNKNNIFYTTDLIFNVKRHNFEIIFYDSENKNNIILIDSFVNFPKKNNIFQFIIKKISQNPIKNIIFN